MPWRTELGARARGNLLLAFIGTSLVSLVFFVGYFYVQQQPAFAPATMPLTWLDAHIPFQPYALGAYLSLWIYVGAGPGLQKTSADILEYALWIGTLCLVGLGIFYLWPTEVPHRPLAPSDSAIFAMLWQVDSAGNACPSMHVAAAVFTAIRIADVLRETRSPMWLRMLNLAVCAAICYSTLAIKQHVVLDLVAGAALGAVFGLLSSRWRFSRAIPA